MNEPEEVLAYFKHCDKECISAVNNFIVERESTAEQMVVLVAKHYSETPDKIQSIDDYIFDVGVDSLGLLEIVIVLQGCIDRTILDSEIAEWKTLQDIANLLNEEKRNLTPDAYTNCGLVRKEFPKVH